MVACKVRSDSNSATLNFILRKNCKLLTVIKHVAVIRKANGNKKKKRNTQLTQALIKGGVNIKRLSWKWGINKENETQKKEDEHKKCKSYH